VNVTDIQTDRSQLTWPIRHQQVYHSQMQHKRLSAMATNTTACHKYNKDYAVSLKIFHSILHLTSYSLCHSIMTYQQILTNIEISPQAIVFCLWVAVFDIKCNSEHSEACSFYISFTFTDKGFVLLCFHYATINILYRGPTKCPPFLFYCSFCKHLKFDTQYTELTCNTKIVDRSTSPV